MKIKGKLIKLLSGTTGLMEITFIPEGPEDMDGLEMQVGDEYLIPDVSVVKEIRNGQFRESTESDK
jgi:hypothetical protein